jgi:transcriptional regulator GlxA family with amidase domain
MSIAQIAQAVGYQGDGHFQQSFKETYGTTPGRLRRELLEKEAPG